MKEPRLDLASLRPLVDGLAATFGATCEVVLHDFGKPDASIVAIAGSVTSRHVGGAMSEIGLGLVSEGEDAEDKLNYITRTSDGRVIKASTMLLRDTEGAVVGALCVNLDITGLRLAAAALGDLIGETGPAPATTVFSDDIAEVIRTVIEQEETRIGRTLHHDSRQGRLELIKALDGRGVFSLPRAANEVAELVGVSRATVYADLNATREFESRR